MCSRDRGGPARLRLPAGMSVGSPARTPAAPQVLQRRPWGAGAVRQGYIKVASARGRALQVVSQHPGGWQHLGA